MLNVIGEIKINRNKYFMLYDLKLQTNAAESANRSPIQ
jgi:hypothetical protein